YARTIVDKTASFLLQGMSFSVDPESPEDVEAAHRREAVLREIHEANDLAALDYDSEVDCAVLGDGAFKVVWDPEEHRVRITSPDVNGLFVWLYPDDHTRFWRLAHRYTVDPLAIRQQEQYYPQILLTNQRAPAITEVWTDEEWEIWHDTTLVERCPNPYGFIPYVVYPNVRRPKQFWGESDIANVREACVELNRALTQLSAILEVSGNPITVLEGVTDSKDIAVEPGSVWEMPPGTKAYLLSLVEHGGVSIHLDYIEALYRILHDLGESPRAAFGGAHSGTGAAASGVALAIELDPLIKRVQRKRLIRANVFRRRAEMALRLHEQFTGEEMRPYRCRISWGSLLPTDRARDILDQVALVNAGIHSRATAAAVLGERDHEVDFPIWLEENRRIAAAGGVPAEPSQSDRLQVT
ncbi:MAG TPA: phage portal protein, partial [Dehalococcoidia bacterium]|nr:phage portal protein [Dehalococcoidia bacterium]